MEVKKIKKNVNRLSKIIIILIILLFSIQFVSANDLNNSTLSDNTALSVGEAQVTTDDSSSNLVNEIKTADNGATISINPGTYNIHNLLIDKNITLQGNGNPRDIIFDGQQISSILLVRNDTTYLTIKNITFINGLTTNFGGAISMETGHVYVDNCIFANNTALERTNAGAISNYGTETQRAYLFVNNTLFINNYAQHDGGAVTTCYASSDIYNCVFINNSAGRDGGAIRVSIYGVGNVADCIFMYNHAYEWGGAYYSWACNSKIDRCIFMNNTGGTNGGAVMVSGNISLTNSIIVNNTSYETGGSFYLQQPMFNTITVIDVHDNLITNNTSPLGKEVYIKWDETEQLFTKFNNNDWGDEDPTDSSVIDPDKVTPRSKVTSTKKSNLLNTLSLDLLTKYTDLIESHFPEGYFGSRSEDTDNTNNNPNPEVKPNNNQGNSSSGNNQQTDTNGTDNVQNTDTSQTSSNPLVFGNSTSSYGEDSKAYELNESKSVSKQTTLDIRIFILVLAFIFILLFIGYKRNRKDE